MPKAHLCVAFRVESVLPSVLGTIAIIEVVATALAFSVDNGFVLAGPLYFMKKSTCYKIGSRPTFQDEANKCFGIIDCSSDPPQRPIRGSRAE